MTVVEFVKGLTVCPVCHGTGVSPKGRLSMFIGGGPDFDCFNCAGKGQLSPMSEASRRPSGKVIPMRSRAQLR